MAVGDSHVFPCFFTPVLTQFFFPKPPTTFLTCFCRGEKQKYAGKKSRLNWGLNSQPPGHESDMLTTEPSRQGATVVTQFPTVVVFSYHPTILQHFELRFKTAADDALNMATIMRSDLERVENIVMKTENTT